MATRGRGRPRQDADTTAASTKPSRLAVAFSLQRPLLSVSHGVARELGSTRTSHFTLGLGNAVSGVSTTDLNNVIGSFKALDFTSMLATDEAAAVTLQQGARVVRKFDLSCLSIQDFIILNFQVSNLFLHRYFTLRRRVVRRRNVATVLPLGERGNAVRA